MGTLSEFLNMATIELEEDTKTLNEVVITGKADDVSSKLDKRPIPLRTTSVRAVALFCKQYKTCRCYGAGRKSAIKRNDKATIPIDGNKRQ